MDIEIFDKVRDGVINSDYLTGKVSYKYAIEKLLPLVNKLDFQRNALNKKFYERLEKDIKSGCVMPPITIAFNSDIMDTKNESSESDKFNEVSHTVSNHINSAFILDGIQRLTTLSRAINSIDNIKKEKLLKEGLLYVNIIISDSTNKLLYKMIVLNNGQKPMSIRHQIEILVNKFSDDINLKKEYEGKIITEKKAHRNDGITKIKKSVLVKSYLAFSSRSINIDNQKIIESKLNQILTDKIMSSEIEDSDIQLANLAELVINLCEQYKEKYEKNSGELYKWFNNENNMIGFFVGIANNPKMMNVDLEKTLEIKKISEEILSNFTTSKIRVSTMRRKAVMKVVQDYEAVEKSPEEFIDKYLMES